MANRKIESILVTGGAGFIGSNFIRFLFSKEEFKGKVINLDALTYAGNPLNLVDIDDKYSNGRYTFVHGDITDSALVSKLLKQFEIDTIVHFAAESHVDRSIHGPSDFIKTNIIGTFTLLEEARSYWKDRSDVLFHHISTDEVYGSLGNEGSFSEKSAYDPHSPYSASKASSDHLVMSYFHTYGLPVTISNCSNNYGPYQFPEKLIPLMILNMEDKKPLPVYGDGMNIRDWVHVADHNEGVWRILQSGRVGQTYNIGGGNEITNIELVKFLCQVYSELKEAEVEEFYNLITYVKDRPGHDKRYAIDSRKINNELGWSQSFSFEIGLKETVSWYLQNKYWVDTIKNGVYRNWMERNYGDR